MSVCSWGCLPLGLRGCASGSRVGVHTHTHTYKHPLYTHSPLDTHTLDIDPTEHIPFYTPFPGHTHPPRTPSPHGKQTGDTRPTGMLSCHLCREELYPLHKLLHKEKFAPVCLQHLILNHADSFAEAFLKNNFRPKYDTIWEYGQWILPPFPLKRPFR